MREASGEAPTGRGASPAATALLHPSIAPVRHHVIQRMRRHPALCLGVLGLLLMLLWSLADLPTEGHPVAGLLFRSWVVLVRPFALVATWIDPVTGRWPVALDVAATLALGLLPYLLLDAVLRWAGRRSGLRPRP
jgi:hypothetical protein